LFLPLPEDPAAQVQAGKLITSLSTKASIPLDRHDEAKSAQKHNPCGSQGIYCILRKRRQNCKYGNAGEGVPTTSNIPRNRTNKTNKKQQLQFSKEIRKHADNTRASRDTSHREQPAQFADRR